MSYFSMHQLFMNNPHIKRCKWLLNKKRIIADDKQCKVIKHMENHTLISDEKKKNICINSRECELYHLYVKKSCTVVIASCQLSLQTVTTFRHTNSGNAFWLCWLSLLSFFVYIAEKSDGFRNNIPRAKHFKSKNNVIRNQVKSIVKHAYVSFCNIHYK